VITDDGLRLFFADRCRLLRARRLVPSPQRRFTRYTHHNTWHVLPYNQALPFDSPEWIEVVWSQTKRAV
jgi:hypothetical protein